ncbi:hypothetical protein J2W83_000823 [Pseudomonas hunanensis]|uniref:Uncharacterized protein n=1 Tax=Pseudomonas hunanensis TaxID=1247546 RepID=A0ACC6JYE2_9PSED|nr:hypothetical protein [Pseudomonas hunanensis]MDR6711233.1 hypothetical protein [Pseudomonas hunanensis]
MDYRNRAAQLLLSAMALVGGYRDVSESSQSGHSFQIGTRNADIATIQQELAELTRGWKDLDRFFADALTASPTNQNSGCMEFGRASHLLHAIRALEISLKNATPPFLLMADHTSFRRAVAGVRGRLFQLDSLHKQAITAPSHVDSAIDFDGLRALADFTSAALAKIA